MIDDRRLLLRVAVKMMTLLAVLFLIYILLAGLLSTQDHKSEYLSVSVVDLAPGEARRVQSGSRWFMVIHLQAVGDAQQAFVVLRAQDPVFGCQVEALLDDAELKSVCAEARWDLQGRLLEGGRDHEDLAVPAHDWVNPQLLRIHLD